MANKRFQLSLTEDEYNYTIEIQQKLEKMNINMKRKEIIYYSLDLLNKILNKNEQK
jgi:hypothetical protein